MNIIKTTKLIMLNLLVVAFLLLIMEFLASLFSLDYFNWYKKAVFSPIPKEEHIERLHNGNEIDSEFREIRNLNSDKKPILIMGCSFAYGFGLNQKDTVSFKMSEMIDNPIYNRAYNSWGLKQMLYLLRNDFIYKEMKEPQYLIYFFISDHISRIYGNKFSPMDRYIIPSYKEKNGELIEKKTNLLERFILPEYIKYLADKNNEKKYRIDKTTIYFNEAKKEIEKHWKNTKFVIAIYPRPFDNKAKIKTWIKEMQDNGFIVINIATLTNEDLTKGEYQLYDKWHPNDKAWDVVLPPLLKELDLL